MQYHAVVDPIVRIPAPVVVGGGRVPIQSIVSVARHHATVVLDPDALSAVAKTREVIDLLADDPDPHYGISTGFGALATTYIQRVTLPNSLAVLPQGTETPTP